MDNTAPSERASAQQELLARFADGAPPDVTQASAGSRLQRWVLGRSDATGAGWLQPIRFLAAEDERFPTAVLELVSFAGGAYAVPLNVHRLNTLFYNAAILAEARIAVPSDWDQQLASCQALRSAVSQGPRNVECLGFSSTPWIAEAFFRSVVLSEAGGGAEAARWWRELSAGDNNALSSCSSEPDPVFGRAFRRLAQLARHFNADWEQGPTWVDLAARLGQGRLAFLSHPDWVNGELLARGHQPGRDYGVVPAPGTAGLFVFSMDTFALPASAHTNPAALAWLERLATPPYQRDFNRLKGSVPALLGTDMTGFDAVTRASQRDFSRPGAVLLPALQLLTPRSEFVDALASAANHVAAAGDWQTAWQNLCAGYATLATGTPAPQQ